MFSWVLRYIDVINYTSQGIHKICGKECCQNCITNLLVGMYSHAYLGRLFSYPPTAYHCSTQTAVCRRRVWKTKSATEKYWKPEVSCFRRMQYNEWGHIKTVRTGCIHTLLLNHSYQNGWVVLGSTGKPRIHLALEAPSQISSVKWLLRHPVHRVKFKIFLSFGIIRGTVIIKP